MIYIISLGITFNSFSYLPQRPFTIELHNFTCVIVDPTIGKELTCILHRKRVAPAVSVLFSLYETQNEFSIVFQMDRLKKDNSKLNLANNKLDGCKFLGSIYGNNIYGKFFKRIQSVSNLPKKCPLRGVSTNCFFIR